MKDLIIAILLVALVIITGSITAKLLFGLAMTYGGLKCMKYPENEKRGRH